MIVARPGSEEIYEAGVPSCGIHGWRQVAEVAGERSMTGTGQILIDLPLEPAPTPAKQEEKNHDYEDEVNPAAAIVADSGTHVVAAATEEKNQDDQNHD